jgi:hypothetical protein
MDWHAIVPIHSAFSQPIIYGQKTSSSLSGVGRCGKPSRVRHAAYRQARPSTDSECTAKYGYGANTNDLTPCQIPLVLSAPPLSLRLRQNKGLYGYAGVVVNGSSATAPSTSLYSFKECRRFFAHEIGRIHFRFLKNWRHKSYDLLV